MTVHQKDFATGGGAHSQGRWVGSFSWALSPAPASVSHYARCEARDRRDGVAFNGHFHRRRRDHLQSNALTAECAGVYIAEELGERRLALLERLAAEVRTVQFKQIEGT
jgi:hypothetical protein